LVTHKDDKAIPPLDVDDPSSPFYIPSYKIEKTRDGFSLATDGSDIEALDFRSPRLSRRLNRLTQHFGQGVLTEKLKALEVQFGIVTERREAAYSSQERHRCHYINPRNRVSQSQFRCKFCGLQQHADIQAARTLRDRRSVAESGSSAWRRRAFLVERVAAFKRATHQASWRACRSSAHQSVFQWLESRGEVIGWRLNGLTPKFSNQ
jgi:hypothetical protein